MLDWEEDVKSIFESILINIDEFERSECETYKSDVYKLYLHSFWLPTAHQ